MKPYLFRLRDPILLKDIMYFPLLVSRILSILPVHVESEGNEITFRWKSFQILYLGIIIGVQSVGLYFVTGFLQHITHENNSWNVNNVDYLAKMVFIVAHIALSVLNYVFLIPLKISSVPLFWKELQQSITFLTGKNNMAEAEFRSAYIRTTCLASFFTGTALTVVIFGVWYMLPYLMDYFIHDEETGIDIIGWTLVCVVPIITVLVVSHLLQAILFLSFAKILEKCFLLSCHPYTEELTPQKWMGLCQNYYRLRRLSKQLSDIYGFFMIFEILVMILTTIMNMYFGVYVALGRDTGYHPLLPVFIGPAYCFWLWLIGSQGEELHQHAKMALESLRNAKLSPNVHVKTLSSLLPFGVSSPPPYLTANNFFDINKEMTILIYAALTTYVLLMVQLDGTFFRSGQPMTE